MRNHYRLYRRDGTFYVRDNQTKKRQSLETKNSKQAAALLATKNEAHQQCALSLHKARIYLLESDPALLKRTWRHVMDEITACHEQVKDPAHELGIFVDETSSKDTRPKKEEILKLLRLGVADGVAFVALDRWGRTMSELGAGT
jgi:hypothetical protein